MVTGREIFDHEYMKTWHLQKRTWSDKYTSWFKQTCELGKIGAFYRGTDVNSIEASTSLTATRVYTECIPLKDLDGRNL